MPEQDEPKPGTTSDPTPDDADGGAAASEDTDADGSAADPSREDELAELRRKNQQLLSEKTALEKAKKELADERARASTHPPATGDDAANRARYENDMALEREYEAGVQPTVEHLLAVRRLDKHRQFLSAQALQETRRRVEAIALPEDLRDDAQKLAEDEGISVKLAARLLKAERAAEGNTVAADDDEERLKRLEAKRDATPAHRSVPVTADRSGKFITRTDFNKALAKFDDEGDLPGKAEFFSKNRSRVRG